MDWILKLIPPERLVMVLTEYLSKLLAGKVKNPSSEQAKALFKALEVLLVVATQVLARRDSAKAQSRTIGNDSFWNPS